MRKIDNTSFFLLLFFFINTNLDFDKLSKLIGHFEFNSVIPTRMFHMKLTNENDN